MDLIPIAFIVVIAIVGFLAFKILENIIKALMTALVVAVLLLGLGAFFVGQDAKDFVENFPEGPNVGLLVDGPEVFEGVVFSRDALEFLDDKEVSNLSVLFEKRKYDEIRGDHYKLIIVEASLLVGTSESNVSSGSSEEESNHMIDRLSKGNVSSEELEELLTNLFDKASDDPIFFVSEIKKGNIRFYEETPLFKVIKLFPISLTNQLSSKLSESVKDISAEKLSEVEILENVG